LPCNGKEITDSFWNLLIFSDPDIVYSFVEITDELIEKIDKEISPYYFSSNPKKTEDNSIFIPTLENPLTNEFLIKDIPKLGLCPSYFSKCPLAVFRMDERSDNFTFILRNFGYMSHLLKFYSKGGDKQLRIELKDIYEDIDFMDIDGRADLNTILDKLYKEHYVIYPMLLSESPGAYFPSEPRKRDYGFLLAIGDGIRNFLYSWNRIHISEGHLRKTLSEMVIPESLLNDNDILKSIKNLITDYMDRVSHASNSQGELILVSCDKTRSELNEIAEFFRRDTYWRIDIRCTSEDFRFPSLNDEIYTPLGFKRPGNIYQFSETKALIPNNGPIPIGAVSELFSENWVMDIDISYRPERFLYTNTGYWWKFPRRSGISYLFAKRLSRINKKGSISFQVNSSEKNIDIDIPEEKVVFNQLISPFYNYMYTGDIRKKKPIYYKDIRYSEKGRYLSGVIGLFSSLWHAEHCFSERFWRRMFEYMSNVKDTKEAKQLTEIEGRARKALKIATQDYPNNLDHATKYLSKFLQSILRKAKYEKVVNFDYLFKNAVRERDDFLKTNPGREKEFAYSDEDLKRDLIEAIQELSESKIFFQGIRPKCNRCGFRNWFTLDEIENELICKGCHMSFKFPAEAEWFYELNELIRRTILNQGVMATLMCLGQILQGSRESFIYIPNICLYENYYKDQSPDSEIDIVCISDGQFIIGEVKHSAKLFTPSDFAKMEKLAQRLRPDKIIIYAFRGPYERLTKNVERFKKKINAYGIDTELVKPYDYIENPSYHMNPF
jgi:hypothetical protein